MTLTIPGWQGPDGHEYPNLLTEKYSLLVASKEIYKPSLFLFGAVNCRVKLIKRLAFQAGKAARTKASQLRNKTLTLLVLANPFLAKFQDLYSIPHISLVSKLSSHQKVLS